MLKLKYLLSRMDGRQMNKSEVSSTFCIYPTSFFVPSFHCASCMEDECVHMHVPLPCCSALKSYKPLNCFRFPLSGKNHVSLSHHAEAVQVHPCVTVSCDWMFQVTRVKQENSPAKSTPVLWSAVSLSHVPECLCQDGAVCGRGSPH